MYGTRRLGSAVGGGLALGAAAAAWLAPALAHAQNDPLALRGRDSDALLQLRAEVPDNAEPTLTATAPPAGDAEASGAFILLGVAIEGAHAFPVSELAPYYEPYLTQPVTPEHLAQIAQRITDHYRAAGYFLSRALVPSQHGGGVARIQIIEGAITEIVLEGDGAAAARPFFRGVSGGSIANIGDLERRLALAGDTPGLSVRSRMEPDPNDLRAHRLIVTADLSPFEARASLDNRGADSAGPWQFYARGAANSLFRARDQAGLGVFTTPLAPEEFALGEASYAVAFTDGARLRISASMSRAHDGADMSSSDVGGDSEAISFSYEFPLQRTRRRGLWLGAAFESRHQENVWASGSGYTDELRVARAALRGMLNENGRATSMIVQASFGLPMLGASDASILRRSRADADATFAKLDFFSSHYRDIGDHFGLYATLAGQWSPEPLLAAEQFFAGGAPFGRGYAYGEIAGDQGLAGLLEFRAGFQPTADLVTFVQGYFFLDAAEVWNLRTEGAALASAGAGVRVTFDDRVTAGLELARPLTRGPSEEDGKDWRQFFSLAASY